MRTIFYIIQKELLQLKRNRTILPILFVLPIVQLLVLVNAATYEIKNTRITFVDNDLSGISRRLTGKIGASPFFHVQPADPRNGYEYQAIEANKVNVALVIPQGFEKKLVREGHSDIQVLINGAAVSSAAIVNGYITAIIQDFNKEALQLAGKSPRQMPSIVAIPSFWFNPALKYTIFMLPGMLVILMSAIGLFMSAMVIVREKELGTIEQLNVTPIRKHQLIVGKMVPFWFVGIIIFTVGITLGHFIFGLPILGSLPTLYLILGVYLVVSLGMGLFFSTFAETQQQVMFVAWFVMVVFLLMSGFFTPAENMPEWAQRFNLINPFAYFIKVNRMILLKGSGFTDVLKEMAAILILAVCMVTLAVRRYRKTS
jgi:ABC-2 type transport system permease protein